MTETVYRHGKPLKILTLDGGGLQALSTLSILGDLCDAIAAQKGITRKPAPYELFDIICGIGTGGWLALLLGRYRLDITQCISVYVEIANAIEPKTSFARSTTKLQSHTHLDKKKLIAKIDQILEKYELDPYLAGKDRIVHDEDGKIRCRYAFAAGAIEHPKKGCPKYEIFRTYETEKSSSAVYHSGPDPKQCKVSAACAATGAAKTLLQPHRIGNTTFSDTKFPSPHNITSLAIDEAYHLYGEKPLLSVIVNVGPGIPTNNDVKKLTKLSRQFSWPERTKFRVWRSTPSTRDATPQNRQTPNRTDTDSSTDSAEEERRIEQKIRDRLHDDYKVDDIYCRLAPESEDSLSLSDVSAVRLSNEKVDQFLSLGSTKDKVLEAARQYYVHEVEQSA